MLNSNLGFNPITPYITGFTKMPLNMTPYWQGMANNDVYSMNWDGNVSYNFWPNGYSNKERQIAGNINTYMNDPMGVGDLDKAVDKIWNQALGQQFLQTAPNTLKGLQASLEKALKSDKLDAAQKSKVQSMLDRVKAFQEKCKEAFKNINSGKYPDAATTEALKKELEELQKDITEKMKTLAEQVAAREDAEGSGNAGGAGDSTGSGTGGTADDEAPVVDGIPVDPETGKASGGKIPKSALESFCSEVNGALVCVGTNHEVLDPAIARLNKDNIVEIVSHWEKNYGKHTATGNDGFFAKILDDIGDDHQATLVPYMRDALAQRAEALGIYDQVEQYVSEVNKELNKGPSIKKVWCGTWMDDHKIANNLMEIYNKIVAKEAKNVQAVKTQKTQKEQEAKKTEAKEKAEAAKKDEKAKAQFVADMREILKDDTLELSDKVQMEAGQFKIRIEGRDYYGSNYRELAKNIKAAGYEPEEYLVKKQLKQAA